MELIRDLRANGLLIAVKTVIVALFAVTIYTFGTFAQSTSGAVNGSLADDRDVELYGLVDSFLSDPRGFERFRSSEQDLASLAEFVRGLGSSDAIDFLSAFDQTVVVRDFAGGDRFDAHAGTDLPARGEYLAEDGARLRDVTSMQMNREAFEFYRLRVATGTAPSWDAVDYASGVLPVLLGSDYRGVYSLDDELEADVYGTVERLRVVGFLEPGSAMFYHGDVNHFLDDTVVVPYPTDLAALIRYDQYLGGVIAFAMVNTDLAAQPSVTYDGVVNELGAIAGRSGFHDYSLQGVPTYLVQLRLVRQIVVDNFALLSIVLTMIGVAVVVVCARINATLGARRARWADVLRTVGHSDRAIVRVAMRSWALEYAAVLALYSAGCWGLPNHHGVPFLAALAFLGAWFGVDALVRRHGTVTGPHVPGVAR